MDVKERVVPELAKHGIHALESLSPSAPNVLLLHGINSDLHEDASPQKRGFFDELVSELHGLGLGTLRFDFSGHGLSSDVPTGVSIHSEVDDIDRVMSWARGMRLSLHGFVGCSFGACATGAYLSTTEVGQVSALVLANPVVDPFATFFDPGTPWSRETVGLEGLAALQSGKTVLLDGEFPLEQSFLESILAIDVPGALRSIMAPTLIVHGTKDTYVDSRYSEQLAMSMHDAHFIGVDSEHGFGDLTVRRQVAEMAASFLHRELS